MDDILKTASENRRSFYSIGKEKVLEDEQIIDMVRHRVKYAPSAFNSQSARVLVLLGREHDRLWDLVKEVLKKHLSEERFPKTEEKLDTFRSGYGTILYFEDRTTVGGLQERFPRYHDTFPVWSMQSSGMLQYSLWISLEQAGFGASLQHYNPLIDEEVKKTWNIPEEWELLSQMPFGKPLALPEEKTFVPLDQRIKIFK